MEQNFHWIQWIQRIWEITEAWIGFRKGSALLPVALWLSGTVSVSYTGGPGFQPCNPPFWFLIFLSLNSANSVKTFRENSIVLRLSLTTNCVNMSHLQIQEWQQSGKLRAHFYSPCWKSSQFFRRNEKNFYLALCGNMAKERAIYFKMLSSCWKIPSLVTFHVFLTTSCELDTNI